MLVKTNTSNKWLAIRAFINLWLKDRRLYCNWCGRLYNPNRFPCCDKPQIGDNLTHTRAVIKQNKIDRKLLKNVFGAESKKHFRLAVNLPPQLLMALEKYVKSTAREGENRKLFENPEELHKFMREFKEFTVPMEI